MRITQRQRNCKYCQEPFKEDLHQDEFNLNNYSSMRILNNNGDYLLDIRVINKLNNFIQSEFKIKIKRCPWCNYKLKNRK